MEEESLRGFGRVADRALEILEVECSLGQPLMSVLRVALKADSYSRLLGEVREGSSSMGVVTLEAEPVADLGVLTLFILSYDLFMALSTINHTQPLTMGNILDIIMAIDTAQITMDRGTKPVIIYIEANLPFSHLLFFRGRNNHLEPFFPAHLEDITGSVAFKTCLILKRKSHLSPRTKGKRHQRDHCNSEEETNRAPSLLLFRSQVHFYSFLIICLH
jgi:hypothetical protein